MSLVHQHEDPVTQRKKRLAISKKLQSTLEDYIQANSYMEFLLS